MKLYNSIDLFYKKATLMSDMAHRIMFGLINKNTFDLPAARWVASGAKKIIRNGVKACYRELGHSWGTSTKPFDFFAKEESPINAALEAASIEFRKRDNWSINFGGEPWARISDTLKDINQLYLDWTNVAKDTEEEVSTLKKLIIMLNKFDGMAHNTGSIIKNLVQEEYGTPNEKIIDTLKTLRDLSESEDPILTYKAIEPHLHPTLPYKSEINQLSKDPEFHKDRTKDIENFSKAVVALKKLKKDFSSSRIVGYYISLPDSLINIHHYINQVLLTKTSTQFIDTFELLIGRLYNIKQSIYFIALNIKDIINALQIITIGFPKNRNFYNILHTLLDSFYYFEEANNILNNSYKRICRIKEQLYDLQYEKNALDMQKKTFENAIHLINDFKNCAEKIISLKNEVIPTLELLNDEII